MLGNSGVLLTLSELLKAKSGKCGFNHILLAKTRIINRINTVMSIANITELTTSTPQDAPVVPTVVTVLPRVEMIKTCAVTVTKCNERGYTHKVRYPKNGRVCKKFFYSEAEANAFAAEVRGDALTNRQKLLLLPAADLAALGLISDWAQSRQLTLTRVLAMLESSNFSAVSSPAIEKVLAQLVEEMEAAHRDDGYVMTFKQDIKRFYGEQNLREVSRFTVDDIMRYFKGKAPGYKKSQRSRLSTLFSYAVRKKYRPDNPCDLLPMLSIKKAPPAVFTLDEVKTCLRWLLDHPKGLAWFINTAFAGMRPQDESCFTDWDKINFEAKCIVVESNVCKTTKRRVVYPEPMVFDWLKVAKERGAQLPLTLPEMKAEQRALRGVLGWAAWKQDVTRHSAASYWLAKTNDVKLVSRSLGHSVDVLESTYDARVFQPEGVAYYALLPAAIL